MKATMLLIRFLDRVWLSNTIGIFNTLKSVLDIGIFNIFEIFPQSEVLVLIWIGTLPQISVKVPFFTEGLYTKLIWRKKNYIAGSQISWNHFFFLVKSCFHEIYVKNVFMVLLFNGNPVKLTASKLFSWTLFQVGIFFFLLLFGFSTLLDFFQILTSARWNYVLRKYMLTYYRWTPKIAFIKIKK